jgi:hypothetical protein
VEVEVEVEETDQSAGVEAVVLLVVGCRAVQVPAVPARGGEVAWMQPRRRLLVPVGPQRVTVPPVVLADPRKVGHALRLTDRAMARMSLPLLASIVRLVVVLVWMPVWSLV